MTTRNRGSGKATATTTPPTPTTTANNVLSTRSTIASVLAPSLAARAEFLYQRHTRRSLLWQGLPVNVLGHVVPIDLTARWRRHLVWAKTADAAQLRQVVTARFTSATVFLTLLVSAELGTFFSPSRVVEEVRTALEDDAWSSLDFWIGIVLSASIFFATAALLANFTALSIFIVVGDAQAALVLRSSMGLYAAQLPSRLVMGSIYLFFAWIGTCGCSCSCWCFLSSL